MIIMLHAKKCFLKFHPKKLTLLFLVCSCINSLNYWFGNKVISFFFMIFEVSLLIQIKNINQLCNDQFVRSTVAIFQSVS